MIEKYLCAVMAKTEQTEADRNPIIKYACSIHPECVACTRVRIRVVCEMSIQTNYYYLLFPMPILQNDLLVSRHD